MYTVCIPCDDSFYLATSEKVEILDFILMYIITTSVLLTSLRVFLRLWNCETARLLVPLSDSQMGGVIARRIKKHSDILNLLLIKEIKKEKIYSIPLTS